MNSSDEELLALLVTDLDTYFDLLVLTYQRPLSTPVSYIVQNGQDAEEVIQDTFVSPRIITVIPSW